MRVWLNTDRLAQLGVTTAQVQAAIAEQNQQIAGGKLGEAPSPSNQKLELTQLALGHFSNVSDESFEVRRSVIRSTCTEP
jgi:multidrug efflux pump subunit AcrB